MTTCPTCGTETDKAVCEVDGTTLDVLAALVAIEVDPRMPADTIALVSPTDAVVIELSAPAPKKRKGKS